MHKRVLIIRMKNKINWLYSIVSTIIYDFFYFDNGLLFYQQCIIPMIFILS